MRRLVRIGFTLGVAGLLVLVTAAPAAAAVDGDYTGTDVRIRAAPNLSSTIHGLGYPGHGATIYCWASGSAVNGNTTWYRHRNKRTGVTGYSSATLMAFGGQGPLGRC
jgi:hypothetical protein